MVTVSNELSPDHRAALVDGVVDLVLGTPQAGIAATVVQAMLDAMDAVAASGPDGITTDTPPQARQLALPVELWTAENL